jgi:D-glycero-D-manno-heptose 1,7-bisphosphate phosphatase
MTLHHPGHAAFLDRDDTLVYCDSVTPHGDLGDPDLVRLIPGVQGACRRLHDAGLRLVVVTNQGGVARGRYTEDDVHAVHQRLNDLLGGLIDAFRHCPYPPQGTVPAYAREHPWRKPAPGMLLDAARELGLDPARCWMVGDKPRDCEAGHAAGCRSILIPPPGAGPPPTSPHAEFHARDIAQAADLILQHTAPGPP